MAQSCNEKNCPCLATSCARHGKCCECINYHVKAGSLVCCMKPIASKNN